MSPEIEYHPDDCVDDALDLEIRGLLTTCFTGPQDAIFKDRRYFREPYPHRWVIRDSQGLLIAHIGVHEKHIETEDSTFPIAGICEVCVHPEHRGKGYIRNMLSCIHAWLSERGFVFSILFGDPAVYGSSGYAAVANLFCGSDAEGWRPAKGMTKELSDVEWPRGKVLMPGPDF